MADDTKPHDRALIKKYPFTQKATHDNFAAFVDQTPATSKEVAAFHVHGHATATGVVKAYADSGVEVKTAHLHYQAKLALLEDHWHGNERPGYITQAMLESSAGFTAKSARRALELFRDYHQIKGPKRKQAKSLKEDTPDASSIEIFRRDKNASQISEPTLDTNADPKDPLFDEYQAQAADLKVAIEPTQTMNADLSGLSPAGASMPLLDSMMTEDLGPSTDIFDPSAIMQQDPYDSEESCISADGIIRHILGRPGIDVEPVTAAERGIAEAARAREVKKEEAKAKRRQNLAEKKEAALEMTEEEKTDAYADALAKEAEKIGRKLGLPASKRRKVVRDARDAVYRNL
ncbi:hypothetical protein K4K61_006905 [Colletotrichum sp. SAR11_59]|nr:hypothetical protein K4K61_006905 [Colletotrichum sp. SAR11_59]